MHAYGLGWHPSPRRSGQAAKQFDQLGIADTLGSGEEILGYVNLCGCRVVARATPQSPATLAALTAWGYLIPIGAEAIQQGGHLR
jgi:hypothetical protein